MDSITITKTVIGPEIKVSFNDEVVGIVNTLQFSDECGQWDIERVKEEV